MRRRWPDIQRKLASVEILVHDISLPVNSSIRVVYVNSQ